MRASGLGCLRLRRRCPNGCSFYLAKCLTWPDSRERRSRAVSLPVSEGSVRRRFGAFVSLPPSKHLEATTELTFVLPYGIGMSSSQVRLSDAGTFSANSLLVLTLSGGDRLTIVAYGASQFGSVGSKPRSTVESAPKSCRRPFGVPGKLSLLSSSRCCGSRRWFCCLPLPV